MNKNSPRELRTMLSDNMTIIIANVMDGGHFVLVNFLLFLKFGKKKKENWKEKEKQKKNNLQSWKLKMIFKSLTKQINKSNKR